MSLKRRASRLCPGLRIRRRGAGNQCANVRSGPRVRRTVWAMIDTMIDTMVDTRIDTRIDTMVAQISSWPKAPGVAVAALLLLLACAGLTFMSEGAPVAAPASTAGSGASVAGGGQGSGEDVDAPAWPDQGPPTIAVTAVKRRCDRCGLVVSMREGGADDESAAAAPADFGSPWTLMAPARYTFTVNLADGSQHRISDSNPLAWRIGERVMVIEGDRGRQGSEHAGKAWPARGERVAKQ